MEPNIELYHTFKGFISSRDVESSLQQFALFFQIFDQAKPENGEPIPSFNFKKWGAETLQKVISEENFKLPNKFFDFSDFSKLKSALGVVLARLAKFTESMNSVHDYCICLDYARAILSIFEKKPEEVKFFFPQLINASRGLLDSKVAAKNSVKYLTTIPKACLLTLEEAQLFKIAKEKFRAALKTPLAEHAINCFLKTNTIYKEIELNSVLEYLDKIDFEWVSGADYWGMIGFGLIFLDQELFSECKEKFFISKFIGLAYHEGIHGFFRDVFENFCWVTPRNVSGIILSHDNLEGGLLIEELIFGHYDLQYWTEPDRVENLENWKTKNTIYRKEEFGKLPRQNIKNPSNSALCEHHRKREI